MLNSNCFKKLTFSVVVSAAAFASVNVQALDLSSAPDAQTAMMKIVGDLDGKDTFKEFSSTIFAVFPGEKPKPIMRMAGFNVLRLEKQANGDTKSMSKEVGYYQDLKTGKIIETWNNPYTGKTVDVVHIANDPVNMTFPAAKVGDPKYFTSFEVAGDVASLRWDIPLSYPNPISPEQYPEESSGPTYLASEHFIWFTNTKELLDDNSKSIPTHYSWFRTGPWLPWMKMGQKPGYLIISGSGKKYPSFEALPTVVRDYTAKYFPTFAKAPTTYVTTNATSWNYYKQLKDSGKLPGPGAK